MIGVVVAAGASVVVVQLGLRVVRKASDVAEEANSGINSFSGQFVARSLPIPTVTTICHSLPSEQCTSQSSSSTKSLLKSSELRKRLTELHLPKSLLSVLVEHLGLG